MMIMFVTVHRHCIIRMKVLEAIHCFYALLHFSSLLIFACLYGKQKVRLIYTIYYTVAHLNTYYIHKYIYTYLESTIVLWKYCGKSS